jgi:hypothetical protein
MLKGTFVAISFLAAPVLAQAPSPTSQARALWQGARDYIVQSADEAPESLFAFRPTPDVRSFGEIVAHVAGAQQLFCALALGEKAPSEDTAKTKPAIVAALREANGYCERAYAQSDAATSGMVAVFGQQRTRLYALLMNATQNSEHYGNLVTYMRINKLVPPSSRPRRMGN